MMWRGMAGVLVFLAVLALGGGYLGGLHPIGDSLAVGRVFAVTAVLVTAVLAALAGLRVLPVAGALFALIAGVPVLLTYLVPGPDGGLVIYQKNLLFRNAELAAVEADIRAANPMLITLQEVSKANQALLDRLADTYPVQLLCPGESVGGTAVASRLPMVPGTGFCGPGLAGMQLDDGGRWFWALSVHLHWPWPFQQAPQIKALLPVLAGLKGPVVMAGDFNMVVWAHGVGQMAQATRTTPARPTVGTYTGFDPWLRLPIDHVFAPAGGHVTLRGSVGSDHLGLLARVGL